MNEKAPKNSDSQLLKKLQALRKRMVGIDRIRISQKRTQDALFESVELYQTLLETSPDPVVLFDLQGRILMVNKIVLSLHGLKSEEEILGKDVVELFAFEERDRVRKEIRVIVAKGAVRGQEFTMITKDGTLFFSEVGGSVILDREGNPLAIISVGRDITARKLAEDKLRNNEKLLRATIEATEDGILVVDAQERITHYNSRFAQMWKIPEDILATINDDRVFLDFVVDQIKDSNEFLAKVQKLYSTAKESLDVITFKDGRSFERYSRPLIPQRKNVGRVWSFRDISGRRRSETILERSEERFRNITEKTGTWIWEVNPEGLYTYSNAVVQQLLGYKQEDLLGKKYCFDLFVPKEMELLKKKVEDTFASRQSCEGFIHSKVHKDGSIVHLETRCSPVFDEHGILIGYQGVDIDITQKHQAELALEESQRMLATLTRNFPGIIYRCFNDEKRTMEFISEGCLDLAGYESDELIFNQKMSFLELIHNDDREHVFEVVKKAVDDREPFRLTYRIVDKNNNKKWVLEKGQAIFSTEGKFQTIEGFITDISDYKNFQEERELLNKELVATNEKLKQLTLRDVLTGLYNHRYFQEVIEAEFDRARRQRGPLSVMMVDLDYFKSINDVYGHKFGDLVLQQLSAQLRQMVRKYDTLIRYSGEEFIIITPGVGRDMAFILAQRLLETVRLENFGDAEHKIKLKCSVGVAAFPEDKIMKGMEFISFAESIVSLAKKKGGDRACSSIDLDEGLESDAQKKEGADDVEFLQDKLDKLTKQANESLAEAIFAFAKTIEMKDHYTGEHVEKTVHYATSIAQEVGLSKNEIEKIRQAAILHDLGKIGISEKILLKDSSLTASEYEEIKAHPQIGVDILRPIHFFHGLLPLILHHHERWDGKGYPYGLKGEEIPIAARILAIADTFEALTSDRCYRKACIFEDAVNVMKENSGTQFDPDLINVFVKILETEEKK